MDSVQNTTSQLVHWCLLEICIIIIIIIIVIIIITGN
jgi:hypothetical protein